MTPEPMVFLGETRDPSILAKLAARGWGRIFCGAEYVGAPRLARPDEPWAFDNGAFAAFRRGAPFDADRFRQRLDNALRAQLAPPRVAVTPDIVAAGLQSLEFSLEWRNELPDEWPWYLAVQDGMTPDDVSPCLDRFAGIFLGGTIRFKSEAEAWCDLARLFSIKFHYGRASTINRISCARLIQADSLDTAFPLWEYKRLTTFLEAFLRPPYDGQLAIGPGAMSPRP